MSPSVSEDLHTIEKKHALSIFTSIDSVVAMDDDEHPGETSPLLNSTDIPAFQHYLWVARESGIVHLVMTLIRWMILASTVSRLHFFVRIFYAVGLPDLLVFLVYHNRGEEKYPRGTDRLRSAANLMCHLMQSILYLTVIVDSIMKLADPLYQTVPFELPVLNSGWGGVFLGLALLSITDQLVCYLGLYPLVTFEVSEAALLAILFDILLGLTYIFNQSSWFNIWMTLALGTLATGGVLIMTLLHLWAAFCDCSGRTADRKTYHEVVSLTNGLIRVAQIGHLNAIQVVHEGLRSYQVRIEFIVSPSVKDVVKLVDFQTEVYQTLKDLPQISDVVIYPIWPEEGHVDQLYKNFNSSPED